MGKDTAAAPPVKKKSKIDNISEEGDIYKKVIDFEAKESAQRTTKEDADAYFKACDEIRSAMAIIHDIKQSENADPDKIRASCTEACVNVVTLKKVNRLIKFRLNTQREDLAAEKQKVDSTHLQLQNLLYELAHVTSEWDKCRQYKSKDEDIELVSIEEFMKTATEDITKPFSDLSVDLLKTDHNLHLARLEHELQQRVKLSQLCAQLEERKVALAADIARKRERLDALGPQLDAIIEASKPLQETLGMPIEKTRAEFRLAGLLSDGLYLLYGSCKSYNNVYETGIEMEIIGDPDLAKQYIDKQQHLHAPSHQQSASNPHLDTFDSDSDQEDIIQPTTNKSSTNNNNIESTTAISTENNNGMAALPVSINQQQSSMGGLRRLVSLSSSGGGSSSSKRRHGSRKGGGGGGEDGAGEGELDGGKKELLEAHPLSVQMTVNKASKNRPLVKISFTYRPNLHLITVNCSVTPPSTITDESAVHVLHGDQLLNELVGFDDNGRTSPNPNTHFQLSRVGLGTFKSLIGEVGYAYVWAQNMCGIEFPQTTKKSNEDLSLTSVETVINALKHRIKIRTKLADQLNHLGCNRFPALPEKLQMPKCTISSINKFALISFQTFCVENDQALSLLEADIINQNSLYYKVDISRPKVSTILHAYIIIDNNYPKKVPIFLLKLQKLADQSHFLTTNNNEDIRELERAVNVECFQDLSPDLHVNILTVQMYYLCTYFDIYLETDGTNKNLEQNSIYFKSVGGRNRRKPFRFRKIGSGIFTQ